MYNRTEAHLMKHIHDMTSCDNSSGGFSGPSATSHPFSADGDRNALWNRLPPLNLNLEHIAAERIVTADRADMAHFTFDILRTKTLKLLRQNKWSSIAITSPTPGCGKTVVSLNLAFSLSHLRESRTVLMDLDLRKPQVANILGLNKTYSMEGFLTGESSIEDAFLRHGGNLVIGPNSYPVDYAAELLQSPRIPSILNDLKSRLKPDVVIYDLPPMLANDDVLAFLPHVDCVMLVAAADASTFSEIDMCESNLSKYTNVLGVVLNKCQYEPERYYGY